MQQILPIESSPYIQGSIPTPGPFAAERRDQRFLKVWPQVLKALRSLKWSYRVMGISLQGKQSLFGPVIYQNLPEWGMFSGTSASHCLAGDPPKWAFTEQTPALGNLENALIQWFLQVTARTAKRVTSFHPTRQAQKSKENLPESTQLSHSTKFPNLTVTVKASTHWAPALCLGGLPSPSHRPMKGETKAQEAEELLEAAGSVWIFVPCASGTAGHADLLQASRFCSQIWAES